MSNKFYITSAILYTNGPPHIGFAMELIQTDVLARYHRMIGDDTWFLTGTDEHGSTVAKAAEKQGRAIREFVDEMAEHTQRLTKKLNISNDDFIRTTDSKRHWPAVEKIWRAMAAKEDLYKKSYEGLYCIGHEAFIKKSDLVDGLCPLHKTEPEKVKEENWFFRLTKYKKEVKNKIESGELEILPKFRRNEMLNLIEDSEDISFSRSHSTLTWGIPVPEDDTQTMYVWADALTNYLSAIGYANETEQFKRLWPADVHLIGKDILRFHAIYWPAMLLSVGLPLPKSVYVHGFINVEGQKMSKTIGNVIDPFQLVDKYGPDVVRYFLLREIPSGEDGDFSYKKLEDRYNGELANGLGNLVQRTLTLIENNLNGELIFDKNLVEKEIGEKIDSLFADYKNSIGAFSLHEALGSAWELVNFGNKYIDTMAPWKVIKNNPDEFLKIMTNLTMIIYAVAWNLTPFMPGTSEKIYERLGIKPGEPIDKHHFRIKKGGVLFPRLG